MVDPIGNHARAMAMQAFNKGDLSLIAPFFLDAMSENEQTRQAGHLAVAVITIELSSYIKACRAKGVSVSREPPSDMAMAYRASCSAAAFFKDAAEIVSLTKEIITRAPGIQIREKKLPPKAPPARARSEPSQSAPVPAVTPPKPVPPAPLEIRIVGMPKRTRRGDVERNLAGEITGAIQVESDF